MIEGWGFNPPPHWPKPPGGWMPPAGWQPDPAWGPVPPGWQLWVADRRPRPRRAGLPVAGWGALLVLAAVAMAAPRAPGPSIDDPRAGGALLIGAPPNEKPEPARTRTTPAKPGRTATPTPKVSLDPDRRFLTCSDLNRVYPNGLGLPAAKDRTSGTPVTDFGRSVSLYRANRAHDRDGDGIACEPG
jgi:hypothetical protein